MNDYREILRDKLTQISNPKSNAAEAGSTVKYEEEGIKESKPRLTRRDILQQTVSTISSMVSVVEKKS